MRWEYLTVVMGLSPGQPLALNAYGSNRWELVTVCNSSDGLHHAVFKRPVEQVQEDRQPHHNAQLVIPPNVTTFTTEANAQLVIPPNVTTFTTEANAP